MTQWNLTRDGVAHDLKNTPYTMKLNYTSNNYVIYSFSSELNRQRFKNKLEENRKKIHDSLARRFGFEIMNYALCDIKLYSMIEKRGFYIKNNKEGFECLGVLRLDGKNLILTN